MIINLQDLAAKRAKPDQGLTISDHTLDLAKFTGSELMFSGTGLRGLVIKSAKQVEISFKDCVIDNAGTGVTLKFDGITRQIAVNGNASTKLFGKAGNSASQMIYFVGVYSDISIGGFEIDQRRDGKQGTTVTGAAVQFAGVLESSLNSIGNISIRAMIIKNAGDEGVYVNHFKKSDGGKVYADGEGLLIDGVKVYRSGRDFMQQQGFKDVYIYNCYGENGGLEADSNHCSALSMNDGETESILVENSTFVNVGQLAFVGKSNVSKKVTFKNVTYDQGTHAGAYSNQAMYLKGNGEYTLNNTKIIAPNVKRSIVCADGATVKYDLTDAFIGSRMDYAFNGGKFIEVPVIKQMDLPVEIEETSNSRRVFLIYEGKRIELFLQ
jgi:hypothetical protein